MEEACWRMRHSEPWRHKLVAHVACALSGFCEIILASTSRSDAQAMPIVHVPSPKEESKYDQTPYMNSSLLVGKALEICYPLVMIALDVWLHCTHAAL